MSVLFRDAHVLEPHEGWLDVGPDGRAGRRQSDRGARPRPADGAAPPRGVIEAHGKLLMPGLVNGHFHSPVNHMKGVLPSLPLELFMLYESPALESLRPSPREAYVRTMLAALEMLRTGVTSVQGRRVLHARPRARHHRRRDAGLCRLRHPGDRRRSTSPTSPNSTSCPFWPTCSRRPCARNWPGRRPSAARSCWPPTITSSRAGTGTTATDCAPPCPARRRSASARITSRRSTISAGRTICPSTRTCWRPSCNACSPPSSRASRAGRWCAIRPTSGSCRRA